MTIPAAINVGKGMESLRFCAGHDQTRWCTRLPGGTVIITCMHGHVTADTCCASCRAQALRLAELGLMICTACEADPGPCAGCQVTIADGT